MTTKINLSLELEDFMADEDLMTLCELQRTGDEVLDVISLSENQHSDILGWLLDPREGHGQGDQILRDLLVAASLKAGGEESGLDRRTATARFFKEWPPSRICTAGFGSAFYARELGMKASERVDLFVIDPQNKFILLIENKASAEHKEDQLRRYHASFNEAVKENSHLRDYHQVYIALDRDFDGENGASRPGENTWIHLGYDWLKKSANRALLHVERGNAAAKLVVSYCNRQTDWESPEKKKCIKLAAALQQKHPVAILELLKTRSGRIESQWLTTKQPSNSLLFMLQNKSVITLLRETRGMASVKTALHAHLPQIPLSSIEHARAWLNVCPSGWEQPEDEWWPLYMNVRLTDHSGTKYNLRLVWNSAGVNNVADAQALRQRLAEIEPRFGSFGDSQFRRVDIEKGLSISELSKKIEELNMKLQAVAPTH